MFELNNIVDIVGDIINIKTLDELNLVQNSRLRSLAYKFTAVRECIGTPHHVKASTTSSWVTILSVVLTPIPLARQGMIRVVAWSIEVNATHEIGQTFVVAHLERWDLSWYITAQVRSVRLKSII